MKIHYKVILTHRSGECSQHYIKPMEYSFLSSNLDSEDLFASFLDFRLRLNLLETHFEIEPLDSPLSMVRLSRDMPQAATFGNITLNIEPVAMDEDVLQKHLFESFTQVDSPSKHGEAELESFLEFFQRNNPVDFCVQNMLTRFRLQIMGLGAVEEFVADKEVTEILVQGTAKIHIEKNGKLIQTNQRFHSLEELRYTCEKIALNINRPFSPVHVFCEGTWIGGERVELIHPSVAPQGPVIAIRKFQTANYSLEQWFNLRSITKKQRKTLNRIIDERKTILIAGPTSAGKTTLLQALLKQVPASQRWVSLEDTPEISVEHRGRVPLLTKEANQEGQGEISLENLLKASLRLRPDRLVVGEVRGREALYLLQALSTGHEGSMATIHARHWQEALSRLLLLAGMHPHAPRADILKELIWQSIDAVLVVTRLPSGKRQLKEIKILADASRKAGVLSSSALHLGHLEGHTEITGTQDAVR